LIAELRKGPHAYYAEGNGTKIRRGEIFAWSAYADGNTEEALKEMRQSADLQDKVGQGEVDIPAREMLADMLLEAKRPKEALAEYRQALKLSPNRFNGLYGAGMSAEAVGDTTGARTYYAMLLKATDNGAQSGRPEIAHAKAFSAAAPATAGGP
jgi:tetratricopeptide (TPR) repeat protein